MTGIGAWLRIAVAAMPALAADQLELHTVKVSGDLGARIGMAMRNNFLAVDHDEEFLRPFRFRKPKEAATAQRDRFRGLGLQISAAVQFARYSQDPLVIARKNALIEETIKTQSPNGYIGMFTEDRGADHLWREWCFHEAAYIVLGLAEDYREFRNARALEAARKLAGYLMANWARRPKEPDFTTLGTAEAFFALYSLTGEREYLRFASEERMGKQNRIVPAPLISWDQDLYPARKAAPAEGRPARMESCHMYRMFERAMMQLRLNQIAPRDNLPVMARRIAAAMTSAERPGMLISGGTGRSEGWHETQDGSGRVAETCSTVYGMWFLDELMRFEGDLRRGDVIERILYNSLLAAQDPQGRKLRYFTPFSGKREYFAFDAFCCPNNFRRGISALARLIYHRVGSGLAVSLYAPSTATVELAGGVSVHLEQKTDYPSSGHVEIVLRTAAPASFPVRLRIPRWASEAVVSVNAGTKETVRPGPPYHQIERRWRSGDRITLNFPMPERFLRGRELQRDRAALARGPVLYTLNPQLNPGTGSGELRDLTLDVRSLAGPFPDKSSRQGGLAYRVKAWKQGESAAGPASISLLLTEFPDPGGEEIYFRLSDPGLATDDELFEKSGAITP
jgi:hypothetical protein